MTDRWEPDFADRLPVYEPLRVHGSALMRGQQEWPDLSQLQSLLMARGVCNANGQPLQLVEQGGKAETFEQRYEARIHLRGELQTRMQNWHDLFNVLVWTAFPRAKSTLSARHHAALCAQQAGSLPNRGPAQDALTLFDEGGVIVVSSDVVLLDDLRDFEWKRLFVERRERVIKHMRWYLFGHAMYEKALRPFEGITARGVLFDVNEDFLGLTLAQQLDEIDKRLAAHIAYPGHFNNTRELAPVPILGVPGWWPDNQQPAFYDNEKYFRAGRKQATRPRQI